MELGSIFREKYKVIKLLGEGGMGKVYLVENMALGTQWAIKEIGKTSENFEIAQTEHNILKKLNHPALPKLYDIYEDEASLFLVVDYFEGRTLDKILDECGHLSENAVIDISLQLCDVLTYLHELKPMPIIYRDLKPSNIIVNESGKVKLIDFGIAREYKKDEENDTVYIGTRGYAAPEFFECMQTTCKSDIYSLGVMMFEMLTGKSPADGSRVKGAKRIFNRSMSKHLETIIVKCVKKDPEERFQSVLELAEALRNKHSNIFKKKSPGSPNIQFIYKLPEDYKKIIGISGSPAAGSTTMILALSEYFANKKKRTALIDAARDQGLRTIVNTGECRYNLDKYRDVFFPDEKTSGIGAVLALVDELTGKYDIVLLDLDYFAPVELIKRIHNYYIVKDMNLYNITETSSYMASLRNFLNGNEKIKIIINKHLKCSVKAARIADALGAPQHSDIQFHTVPFELDNYRLSIENASKSILTYEKYSESFKAAIAEIAAAIYPV